ncbi:MAG: hypothetical protein EB023_02505 [Flavobacteriia bacterium]|nr:hypothetical protein [Flavobacteriia bacterium]
MNFANCNPPSITLIAPSTSNTTVASAAYVVTFSSLNTQNSSEITITQNGMALTGVALAGTTATLPVILQVGANVFDINVNNGCGFDQSSFTITYTLPNNNNNNNNNNNGGKPGNNNNNNSNGGKPVNNNDGGKTPVNNTTPVKQDPPKDVKPATNTPAPAPVKQDPPKEEKPLNPTPSKVIKPVVKPGATEPENKDTKSEEKQPEKGGGK